MCNGEGIIDFFMSKYDSLLITEKLIFIPGLLTVRNTEMSSKIREESNVQKFNLLVRAYDLGMTAFGNNFIFVRR